MATSPSPPPYYRVRRTIARALFGAVFESESPPSKAHANATVAVKTVSLARAYRTAEVSPPSCDTDDPRQEWRVAKQLTASGGHANVLCFFDQQIVCDGDSHDYTMVLVSELCTGGDLFSLVSAQPTGALAEPAALGLLCHIARGVAFLHTQLGVAHRDVSFENVLLRDGVCKLADFGLSTDATQPCVTCAGKDYYMAPEVVAVGEEHDDVKPYDPRAADVWSLGIVLFILLTGSPLVGVASHVDREFQLLASYGVVGTLEAWGVREELSDACVDLLARMLQVEPHERLTITQVLTHKALQL